MRSPASRRERKPLEMRKRSKSRCRDSNSDRNSARVGLLGVSMLSSGNLDMSQRPSGAGKSTVSVSVLECSVKRSNSQDSPRLDFVMDSISGTSPNQSGLTVSFGGSKGSVSKACSM